MAKRHRAGWVEAARSGRRTSREGRYRGGMNVIEAREAWLLDRRAYYRDQEAEDAAAEAFAAGWNAARPAIQGVSSGHVTHNGAQVPDELEATIWGHTKKGRDVTLTLSEEAVRVLLANLGRIGFYPS